MGLVEREQIAEGERPRWGTFCLRRSLRVLPAYWVVLAVYAFVPDAREQTVMAPLSSFLTFTQNFGLEGGAFSLAWSLCIEEQFYVALPLLVFALAGRVRWRGVVALVLGIVLLGDARGRIARSPRPAADAGGRGPGAGPSSVAPGLNP